jgi:hypothetical protein
MHTVEGATGTFAEDLNQTPYPIHNQGFPVRGGACICNSSHTVYVAWRDGEAPFNPVVAQVEKDIDDGAIVACEQRADFLGFDGTNNCADVVSALEELPEDFGVCSFQSTDPDACAPDFSTGTGGFEGETGTGGGMPPDMMDGTDTSGETGGPIIPAELGMPTVSAPQGLLPVARHN